jgi:hypothetical protein
MHYYLYVDTTNNNAPLLVMSKTKPSEKRIPKRGTWIVKEWYTEPCKWVMPCFPEITWNRLKQLKYIGKIS